jgi:hypothetical protein
MAEVAGVNIASVSGLRLLVVRADASLTYKYSTDNGITYTTLGTSTVTASSVRAGLFANSGLSTLATVLVDEYVITSSPSNVSSFTIAGGPNLRYIRSQAPHTFRLDGKVDPDAKAKVRGWVAEVVRRISVAKTALLANQDPAASGVDGTVTLTRV